MALDGAAEDASEVTAGPGGVLLLLEGAHILDVIEDPGPGSVGTASTGETELRSGECPVVAFDFVPPMLPGLHGESVLGGFSLLSTLGGGSARGGTSIENI